MLKDVLREARTEIGLKQEDVAKAVNVTKQTYLKWENGTTEPKASQVEALARVLKISANEICRGSRNTRYDLEKFIIELSLVGRPREIELLRAWEHIPDHAAYIESLLGLEESPEEKLESQIALAVAEKATSK